MGVPSHRTPEIEPDLHPLGMETTGRRGFARETLGWALQQGLSGWQAQLEGRWLSEGQRVLGSQSPLGETESRAPAFEACFYLAAL